MPETTRWVVLGESKPGGAITDAIYAGCSGWIALLSSTHPRPISTSNIVTGAGASACLAAANIFRKVFLSQPEPESEVRFSTFDGTVDGPGVPDLDGGDSLEEAVLVGLGAVGQAAIWLLARSDISGTIHVADPERVELGNLQRYVLTRRSDVGAAKTDIAGTRISNKLSVHKHACSWEEFVIRSGFTWDRVIVAVDSRQARRAVQSSLPRAYAEKYSPATAR
jgi:hypothetical protein